MDDEKQSQPPPKVYKSEEEHEKVIKLLEKRLEKHDDNRKIIQGELTEILNKLRAQIDGLENEINKELCEKFISEEDRLQRALNELCGSSTTSALQKVKAELSIIQYYEITQNKEANNDITTLYKLKTERRTAHKDESVGLAISKMNSSADNPSDATEMSETPCDSDKFPEERERLVKLLEERLQTHDENKKAMQDKIHEIHERLRAQICELEDKINKELEGKFASEDNRLQTALNELRGNRTASTLQKAKAELLVEQSYELIENKESNNDLTTLYELKAERRVIPELMETRKPTNVRTTGMNRGRASVEFTCFNPDEERVLSDNTIANPARFKCMLFKKDNEQESKEEYPLDNNEGNNSFLFTPDILGEETTYGIRVKIATGNRESEWSDEIAEFTTPEFKECCVWKKCPDDINDSKKYSVGGGNPRIATKANDYGSCTIIGNTLIPFNKVTSWSIKILKSKKNDGDDIYIGIAPSDINQNVYNNNSNCGWYFDCYRSWLYSGYPHKCPGKGYGPRKGDGEYVHTGDSVGVVMDTTKGELSFILNGVNHGIAYEGIPLDKPLVPCVLLLYGGGSVELDTSEVKENVDNSIPVPSNITAKSITCDTIALTWDKVVDASFYQIEVDGSKSWDVSTTNSFTKRGLLLETEHCFKVRAVRGSSVSEWGDVMEVRTLKAPEFSECVWKKCPDDIDNDKKYRVCKYSPRVAINVSRICGDYCTMIGNAYIPPNKITSWNIKVLKSWGNDGNDIYIGIAPNDINQNDFNRNKCGWYFHCYDSSLYSGAPHNYWRKDYGSRKERKRQYVHTGDSVGVVMDTTKGDLSFILNSVNFGVAYEGIPLDKPLVPCVILIKKGDSIELII